MSRTSAVTAFSPSVARLLAVAVPVVIAVSRDAVTTLSATNAESIGERARQIVLGTLLDRHLATRDFDAANAINKILSATTKRLCALLREHAAACHVGCRDVMVAVAHVGEINLGPKA
jgi:hypothetical protein